MHQIQLELSDEQFRQAERRVVESGLGSVTEYVQGVVAEDLDTSDHLFTPERLAKIDKALEQAKAGKVHTMEGAHAELERRRIEWLKNRSA